MTEEAVTDLTRGVYRRLYSGFIRGQRINRLSLPAEAWFWRLVATADDFGNGYADPELCHQATVGRRKKVTPTQIEKWLAEMQTVGLLEFYEVKGERYFHLVGFEEWQPAARNGKRYMRFPGPSSDRDNSEKTFGASGGIQSSPGESKHPHNQIQIQDQNQNDHQKDLSRSMAAQVRFVFSFWQEHLNHPKAILDGKRERVITQRLKDGYSVDDLTMAVRGLKLTPYNMGQNDRRQVYDDIELVCRDAKHVDMFIGRASFAQNTPRKPTIESVEQRAKREGCERCFGTGTERVSGKGARPCDHSERTERTTHAAIGGSESFGSSPTHSEARVS